MFFSTPINHCIETSNDIIDQLLTNHIAHLNYCHSLHATRTPRTHNVRLGTIYEIGREILINAPHFNKP